MSPQGLHPQPPHAPAPPPPPNHNPPSVAPTTDVGALLRRALGVSEAVLPSVTFTSDGMRISWLTSGSQANELTFTALNKTGGPTMPNFAPTAGQAST